MGRMKARVINGYRLNVTKGSDSLFKVVVQSPSLKKETVALFDTKEEAIRVHESLTRLYTQITNPAAVSIPVVQKPQINPARSWVGSHQVGCIRINNYDDGSLTVTLDNQQKGWRAMQRHLQQRLGVYTAGDGNQKTWHFLCLEDVPKSALSLSKTA